MQNPCLPPWVATHSTHEVYYAAQAFAPGRLEWRAHLLNAEMPQAAVECGAIATVTVVNQKPWWQSIPRAALHYLLGHPLRGWKWRYCNVQDFPINVSDYKEDIERLKQYCLDTEEIASPAEIFLRIGFGRRPPVQARIGSCWRRPDARPSPANSPLHSRFRCYRSHRPLPRRLERWRGVWS